ncbi:MAG: translation initiation factor IF-2 [Myxococcota bacterium]|nr:translation initiation factor IF-2 [Myxococcota bacterium]
MGKVRVHELAKKVGLTNSEVIGKLQAGGLAVKTHSSSVHEDEAMGILGKEGISAPVEKAKPKRKGMMIVRKKDKEAASVEASEEAPAADVVAEPTTETQLSEGSSDAVETSDLSGADVDNVAGEASVDEPVALEEEKVAVAVESSTEEIEKSEADAQESPDDVQNVDAQEVKKDTSPVLRMIDVDKLKARTTNHRLSGNAPRPAPTSRQPKFGAVQELQVVQDPFGRGREMIDVGRDKKGNKVKPTTQRKVRTPGKREMSPMRERVMYPTRLRKKKGSKRTAVEKVSTADERKASKRVIKMKESITVADLAHQLGLKGAEVVGQLMDMGTMVTINQAVDFDTAQIIAEQHEFTIDSIAFSEDSIIDSAPQEEVDESKLKPRPPVVTVMGHVDHGKTSILDAIRRTKVADGEAGGITQHIGAYTVSLDQGEITFLDTPGHAAFTSMRARGAGITDIVIIVVAADDGLMPQTEEAIKHAQAAGVPIIVALNKIDKAEAEPDRVIQELTQFNLLPEDWGGDTLYVKTSATEGTGIKELLESILLQAEVLELKSDPDRAAQGVVVEAKLDKGRGAVATVLIQEGTLNRGDAVVVGEYYGKVRAMSDEHAKQMKTAGPSYACEIIGLNGVPDAGDTLNMVKNTDAARTVAEHRENQRKTKAMDANKSMSLDDLMARMDSSKMHELHVVLKADVQGSVEAVTQAFMKLSDDEVKVNVVYGGVGAIKESDIMLASASEGVVIGFSVRPDAKARQIAEKEGVDIRLYNVIYEAVDEIKKSMEGLLDPDLVEKTIGRAEVRELFRITKVGTIAGCRVLDGKAQRAAKIRVVRDSVPVYEGRPSSLKHFKNDVREVDSGAECGVGVEGFNDLKMGDVLEFFMVEEIERKLGSAKPIEKSEVAPSAPSA